MKKIIRLTEKHLHQIIGKVILESLHDLSEKDQIARVKQYPFLIKFIQNPTEKVKQLVQSKG